MREFELMFIVDGTMPEEEATAVAATVQSFISSKGTILKADPWGRRRMAYPINKKQDGYYWVVALQCEPGDVDVLKQQLRVNESIIRWMVTRPEHKKTVLPVEAVVPVVPQETAPAPEALPEAAPVPEQAPEAAPVSAPASEPTPAPEA
ncbi:MAG TPA: 30S ribosomal protein S6 [Clostridia bacterium]|nr:30S ribosomal protein S6 [Clostridia bacterium]